jgi:hypothetical protein
MAFPDDQRSGSRAPVLLGLLLLLGILAAAAAVVFAAGPLFPSQDGPIHLYYAEVTRNLFLGTGVYEDSFVIRHLLSPYIFQTYLLTVFNSLFDPLVSEKLLVCTYIGMFLFGFRYLVRSVLPGDETGALFAVPFLFNYFVYAGNYNYALGIAFVLWGVGCTITLRLPPAKRWRSPVWCCCWPLRTRWHYCRSFCLLVSISPCWL